MKVRPGSLAGSEEQVFADLSRVISLRDAVVVEIGGALPAQLTAPAHVARWISIDPRILDSVASDGVRHLLRARGESMPLRDASADVVFSSNALQFIDARAMLNETRRILRPGGIFFAHFGPIWSGPDGHQLEYVEYRGQDLLFWRDTLLPPYAHLQYDSAELLAVLRTGVPGDLAELLTWHVHTSGTINRLYFEDYLDAISSSGLVCEDIAVCDALDYQIRPPAYRSPPAWQPTIDEVGAIVEARTGSPKRIGVRDVRLVLSAPGGRGSMRGKADVETSCARRQATARKGQLAWLARGR